ncbi:MAG UNVERIFIED_CONTAM: hypothetical protein LVQ98_09685 [Rickettsiaceae bacterium]|jgi:hypothetical protein
MHYANLEKNHSFPIKNLQVIRRKLLEDATLEGVAKLTGKKVAEIKVDVAIKALKNAVSEITYPNTPAQNAAKNVGKLQQSRRTQVGDGGPGL